jgi:hypothetical protein
LAKAINRLLPSKLDQLYLPGLTRLEPHRGAGDDVKAHAPRLFPFELQRRIGLEKMIVAANLNGPVASIADRKLDLPATTIEFDLIVLK